jgi:hypothetical protein
MGCRIKESARLAGTLFAHGVNSGIKSQVKSLASPSSFLIFVNIHVLPVSESRRRVTRAKVPDMNN